MTSDTPRGAYGEDFTVFYQPRFAILKSGSIELVGAEALLRRRRSKDLPIQPFIEESEKNGSIRGLTSFVVETCMRDITALENKTNKKLNIAINISPVLLEDVRSIKNYISIIDESKFDKERIEFEITEGASIKNQELAKFVAIKLRDAGFGLALDDFGVGLSGFLRVDYLPLTTIKLDKYFTFGIGVRRTSELIVRNTVEIAKQLNLRTVAEGVENLEQFEFIKNAGFNEIQGFLLAKPMPFNELLVMALNSLRPLVQSHTHYQVDSALQSV